MSARKLEFDDRELTIWDWSVVTGLADGTIRARLRAGWSIRRTLVTPSATTLEGGLAAYQTGGGVIVSRHRRCEPRRRF